MNLALNPGFWTDSTNALFLNPRLSEADATETRLAFDSCVREHALQGTVGLMSSGSTGSRRLVLLTKDAFLESARSVNHHLEITNDDVWLKVLPSFHVGGLSIFARASLLKNRVIEVTEWDPSCCTELMRAHSVTVTALVPTQIFDLVKEGLRSPPSLRAVVVGGARLDDQLCAQARSLGWPLVRSFGMTECCSQIATEELGEKSPQETLRLLGHVEARVRESERLEIRSRSLFCGEILFSEQGFEFQKQKQGDWFVTGDRAQLSNETGESGKIWIRPLGRVSDQTKILGELVSLSRLQSVLESLRQDFFPSHDACVLLKSDERNGAKVIFLCTQNDPQKCEQIVRKFNLMVMPYERIQDVQRDVFVRKSIPRSSLGKVLVTEALQLVSV